MTVTMSGTKNVRIPERLRPGHVRRTSAPTLPVPSCNVALLYLDVLKRFEDGTVVDVQPVTPRTDTARNEGPLSRSMAYTMNDQRLICNRETIERVQTGTLCRDPKENTRRRG